MGRPKGLPKTGGRKPGALNIRTKEVHEILKEKGFNVIEKFIELYERTCQEEYTGGVAVKCLSELASYVYPKKGHIQVSGDVNFHHDIAKSDDDTREQFIRLVKNSTFLKDPEVRKQIIDITPRPATIKPNS